MHGGAPWGVTMEVSPWEGSPWEGLHGGGPWRDRGDRLTVRTVVVDGLARGRVGEARSAVGHHALPLRRADRRAQIGLLRLAEDAVGLPALGRVAGDDMIASLDGCDTLAHALDDGAGLVAQNGREEA